MGLKTWQSLNEEGIGSLVQEIESQCWKQRQQWDWGRNRQRLGHQEVASWSLHEAELTWQRAPDHPRRATGRTQVCDSLRFSGCSVLPSAWERRGCPESSRYDIWLTSALGLQSVMSVWKCLKHLILPKLPKDIGDSWSSTESRT